MRPFHFVTAERNSFSLKGGEVQLFYPLLKARTKKSPEVLEAFFGCLF